MRGGVVLHLPARDGWVGGRVGGRARVRTAERGALSLTLEEAVRWERRALQLKTRQTMSTVTPSVMSHMPLARWAAKADTRGATRRSIRACGRAGVDGRDGAFLAAEVGS